MSAKPETIFRKRVTAYLKTLPNLAFFPIQQSAICGTPDFLICVKGHFVALELKAEGGRLSKLQSYNLNLVLDCGGTPLVIFPSDFDVLKTKLKRMAT